MNKKDQDAIAKLYMENDNLRFDDDLSDINLTYSNKY